MFVRTRVITDIYTRTSFSWDVTQRRLVISCRRFGETYPSHLLELEDGTVGLPRKIGNQLSIYVA